MDLGADDFFGPFGATGFLGTLFLVVGLAIALYAYVAMGEYQTFVGQIRRLVDPEESARYADLLRMILLGSGLAVFGFVLVALDYIGEE